MHDTAVELADDSSRQFFDFVLAGLPLRLVVVLEACYIELAETVLYLGNKRLLVLRVVLDEDAFGLFELLEGFWEPTEHAVCLS